MVNLATRASALSLQPGPRRDDEVAPNVVSNRPAMPELSVVVASVEASQSIDACLDSMRNALADTDAELLVVDASGDSTAARVEERGIALLRCAPGTLTPDLWAEGIRRSRGRVVALTTGHCIVAPGWGRALVEAIHGTVVGAAGSLGLAPGAGLIDWAVFYLRYSEFIGFTNVSVDDVPSIPADNAGYDGESVRAYSASHAHGFWEVDFHRIERSRGRVLAFRSGAFAMFGRSFPFRTILRHRFAHGRHSGVWRLTVGDSSRARTLVSFPLVPFLLMSRIARRVVRQRHHRLRFLASAPIGFALATAWACGEAWGAMVDVRKRAGESAA